MEIIDRKNTIIRVKNVSDGLDSSRLEMLEQNHELEDRSIEFTQSEQQRENRLKKITAPQRPLGQ